MLKSILFLGALLAPATAFFAMPTPAPKLAKRADDIECSVLRYKLETADPPPETPDVVASIAEATTTFLVGEYFNVTDACKGPEVTGDAGDAISSYLEAATSWSSKHQCELSRIYTQCTGAERYSSQNLDPSFYCTKFQEEAAKANCTAESGASTAGVPAGIAMAGLAVVVAAVVAW